MRKITKKWLNEMRYRTFERQVLSALCEGQTVSEIQDRVAAFGARYAGESDVQMAAKEDLGALLRHEGTLR
jgi:hypothetical protein